MKVRYTDRERYPNGYVTAKDSDIRKTFARIRKQQAEEAKQRAAIQAEQAQKVRKLGSK
jgi:hypothetical protein